MSQAQCAIIIFFKDNVIALAEKLRNRRNKKRKNWTNSAELSDIEISSNIVIHYCDLMLWFDCIHQLIKRLKRYQFRLYKTLIY